MAVAPLAPLLDAGVRFRSWREGEPASVRPNATDACASASECALLPKDLWALGRGRVFVNPRVRVYYSHATRWMHALLVRPLDATLTAWVHRLGLPPVLRGGVGPPLPRVVDAAVAAAVAADAHEGWGPARAPAVVDCGIE
jgi:hypothetical protein